MNPKEVKAVIRKVAKEGGAHLAVLFGSFARGSATSRSDIDVLFVEPTDKPYLRRLDKYFDVLADSFKRGVDVFVYTPEEFNRMKSGFFVGHALKHGVVVYER